VAPPELPPDVREVAEILRASRRARAVAGGWALELALGRVTPGHTWAAALAPDA